jgi:3-oxoadipate CoA-transferase alpha subunit
LPVFLLDSLLEQGAKNLTLVSNNAGTQGVGIAKLIAGGRVKKMICSFPRQPESGAFDELYRQGKIELELVPQGTLAERIRAGGAGIGGFFTPTGFGTELAKDKECREIDGINYVFEKAIQADFALIKADKGDRWGNLVYHGTARNFAPIMATAAKCTIAQVNKTVQLGELDPEAVVTPGIFVKRIVLVEKTS